MNEDFLHYIWKFKLFEASELYTTEGIPIKILKQGEHNRHAGPDFFNARILLGNTEWAGNIEVHITSDDWFKHKHDTDKNYDNIILHVVHEENKKAKRLNGDSIPTLELKHLIRRERWLRYLELNSSADRIPCNKQVRQLHSFIVSQWKSRLLVERMEQKALQLKQILMRRNYHWEDMMYEELARNFGFHVNGLPFEMLAKSTPSTAIAKHRDSLLQLEALLFGQAGMLETSFEEKYPTQLQNEYRYLRQKFRLTPIDVHLWKYLRLRPSNFPSVRVAQFAALLHKSQALFSSIIQASTSKEIMEIFNAQASTYWDTHYMLDKPSKPETKSIGKEAIENIIINTVAPLLFLYSKEKGVEDYADRAVELLERLHPEKNHVVNDWKVLGINALNASESQALLQLKSEYCTKKRCLDCAIGNFLIKNS